MQPIAGVLETVLYAKDLDAAERFYGGALGLQLDSRSRACSASSAPGPRCCSCSIPRPPPAIARCRRMVPSARDTPASPCPRPSSTRGSSGSRPQGVAVEHEQTWPRGGRSFYVRDPAGNSIEFATPRIWGLPEPTAVPQ